MPRLIPKKLTVGFAIATIAIIANAWVSYRNISQLAENEALVTQWSFQKHTLTVTLASLFSLGLLVLLYFLIRRDIPARQQAADTLQERENHLRAILDAEPECVKIVAADGTLLERNPAGLTMIAAPNAASVLGQSVYALVVPEHQAALRDRRNRHLAEAALQEKEERLWLALDAAQMGLWDWDVVNDHIIWSDEHERLFGLAPHIFDGTYATFAACIHPDDRESLSQAVNRAREEHTDYNHELRVVWADGSIHWIEGRGKLYYNAAGDVVRMLGTVRDVSVRKQAESALQIEKRNLELRVAERTAELLQVNQRLQQELDERQKIQVDLQISQAQFAGILDIAEDAIVSIDTQQQITLFNQGAERIFGYSAQEVIGQPLDLLLPSRFIQAHRQHVTGFKDSSIRARRMGERRELYGRHKNGSEFPAEASISKFNSGQGTVFTVFLQDVTERKQIDRMKDEFVSVVSHELRTPLTSIHGSLGMLVSGLLKPDSDQGKRMLQIAVDSTDRLVRLINDILDIERIESNRVTMEKDFCQVNDLLAEAVNTVQALADKAGVTLSVASLPIQIWADPDRIIQTLTNLLSNAIKFSSSGTTVWLTVQQQSDRLLLTVKDQGRGIPGDKLDSIFERFQQVDSSDSRNHEGTGLGLAICRSIVQQHNGQIWVESVLGEGSTFFFTLPLQKRQETNPSLGPSSGQIRVLVVEDDADLAQVLVTLFEQHGITAFHAATGQDAVRLSRQINPDLLVLDLVLPEGDGFTVVESLQQDDQLCDIPLVVYSAKDLSSSERDRLKLGRTEFLSKGRVTIQEFEQRVMILLQQVTQTQAK